MLPAAYLLMNSVPGKIPEKIYNTIKFLRFGSHNVS